MNFRSSGRPEFIMDFAHHRSEKQPYEHTCIFRHTLGAAVNVTSLYIIFQKYISFSAQISMLHSMFLLLFLQNQTCLTSSVLEIPTPSSEEFPPQCHTALGNADNTLKLYLALKASWNTFSEMPFKSLLLGSNKPNFKCCCWKKKDSRDELIDLAQSMKVVAEQYRF